MKPGDFLVFKTNGWAARWIQFGTRSRWNHAAIYEGQGFIIEAEPSNVQRTRLESYPFGSWRVSHIPLSDAERAGILAYAESKVGCKYGWLDIVALALVNFGIRPKWLDQYAANDDRLVCSQLVSYAYDSVGVRLYEDAPWTVSPGDLAEIILEGEGEDG